MEDTKVKAAKEFYESVRMTEDQLDDILKTLGFRQQKYNLTKTGGLFQKGDMSIHYVENNKGILEVSCCTSKAFRIIENPRYANQIQQLIKDTNENTI